MPASSVVRAKIEPRLREQAAEIYAAAGLTLEEAFRMMLLRTVVEKAMPFDPLSPNLATVEAMLAARHGELVVAGTIENLLIDLHADD